MGQTRRRLRGFGGTLLFVLAAGPHLLAGAPKPKPNDPVLTIPLEPLGFLPPASKVVGAGATQFTLNYVDDTHLLFTYFSRGLMARLPDTRPGDNDGNVTELLLELPTGKVLARSEFRVRDRDTYLWPLGHGRFLIRVRSRLTMLEPLANLAGGDAFKQEIFGDLPRRIGYITTSATGDLLTLETIPVPPADPATAEAETNPGRPPVEIFFYRMSIEEQKGQRTQFVRQLAGAVAAANLINVPADADGYLSVQKESAGVYNFDFHPHTGGTVELAPFDTTCPPHASLISRSEFVALGCHGAQDKPVLGGFNLKGENAWIEVLQGNHVAPFISASPASGRFALSRTVLSGTSSALDLDNITPAELAGQEITIRQSYDGRLLLKAQADPVQRASQNFDLSPDGTGVAIVRAGGISIYRLPELNIKDRAALKMAQAMEPARNQAEIRLNSVTMAVKATAAVPGGKEAVMDSSSATAEPSGTSAQAGIGASRGVELIPGEAPVNAAAPAPVPASAQPTGDVPQQQRKPPSLYTPDHPRQPGDPKPNGPPS